MKTSGRQSQAPHCPARVLRHTPGSLLALVLITAAAWAPPARADRIPFAISFLRAGYEQVARRRGVTAYRHTGSSFLRMGAQGRFEAPPDQVLAALLDYNRHARFMPRLAHSRILKRASSWMLVYQRLRLPVISDRDVTLKVGWGKTAGGVTWVHFHAAPGKGPASPGGVVRITRHHGFWQLKAASGGRATLARFQVTTSMGGWMPSWMAKPHAGKDLPELYQSLARLVRARARLVRKK